MTTLQTKKKNLTVLKTGKLEILFSYSTPVAVFNHATGARYVTDTFYSRTTSRHIKEWLDGANAEAVKQETLNKIMEGISNAA